ncbi:MAG: aldehyde ferredoxin oxidoreductase [Deltaproteobacteria bacterium]|nr:aldehyde ferredoxin oxidoreductase [Deltaproteobacteria bacterium]
MITEQFRILKVDLTTRRASVVMFGDRSTLLGGSGLAAALFLEFGLPDQPWDHPDQPFILAIGSLTGLYPLMSKTVCGFKSPYHDQYAESHAGGRSALALRFTRYDALVVTGRAERPAVLGIGSRRMDIRDVPYLWGRCALQSGKVLRRMFPGSGHRSILRIGPAGENRSAMACINVDTYRHFGRLGSGGVMGAKNLKAIALIGDADFALPGTKDYPKLFKDIFLRLTATDMMSKYHNYGTAVNLEPLNELKSLPWRNLQQTADPGIETVTGQNFADETLLRNAACAGCPVGCIHIGFVRQKFMEENQYLYRQVAYDYEPIFSLGTMLGVTDPFAVLTILDEVEKAGLDAMSAGVALAWATEALEKGVVSEAETLVPLTFGDSKAFELAVAHLGNAANDFYRALAQGALAAADIYGGADFACVLGQEMAGYATGETFFASQSLSFRHSHLDTGAYTYDQKHKDQDVAKVVDFLVKDEAERCVLTSMVSCLFARGVYTMETLQEALAALGLDEAAQGLPGKGEDIQRLRWRARMATGYDPESVRLPKRFLEVETWKGPIDPVYLDALRREYALAIRKLGTLPDQTAEQA